MKFLCLHGRASFRLRLDPSITFDFVDGAYPSTPAPDIVHFYSGPYYQHWDREQKVTEAVLTAHEWLLEKIARDGPYDGVMLFSQGCSVIASFLMHYQAANPGAPSPFKTAIFICGGIPLQVLEDLGVEVSKAAYELDDRSRELLLEKNQDAAVLQSGKERWAGPTLTEQIFGVDGATARDPKNIFGLDTTKIPENLTIKIPTVHIYGYKDPRYAASVQLAHLCDPENRKMFDHGGGHDIPRAKEVSVAIANLVNWTVNKSTESVF